MYCTVQLQPRTPQSQSRLVLRDCDSALVQKEIFSFCYLLLASLLLILLLTRECRQCTLDSDSPSDSESAD